MNNTRHAILSMFVVLLMPPQAESQEPLDIKQRLQWLPEDTETVIVANGPFELDFTEEAGEYFLKLAQSLPCGLVTNLPNKLLRKELQGLKISIAIEGSRRFTSPTSLGMMPFEGCQILQFEPSANDAVEKAIEICIQNAPRSIEIDSTKVAVFTTTWELDEWTLFVAKPQPSTLICATNQKYLEQVLDRMKGEKGEKSFPATLPEWQHVDIEAPVWAIRHYRKKFSQEDPSSPLRSKAAANTPDPDAIGFVFWLDSKGGKTAEARYLTNAKDAVKIVTQGGWFDLSDGLIPTIQTLNPGVVGISMALNKDAEGEAVFLFVLMGYLGHGVYL